MCECLEVPLIHPWPMCRNTDHQQWGLLFEPELGPFLRAMVSFQIALYLGGGGKPSRYAYEALRLVETLGTCQQTEYHDLDWLRTRANRASERACRKEHPWEKEHNGSVSTNPEDLKEALIHLLSGRLSAIRDRKTMNTIPSRGLGGAELVKAYASLETDVERKLEVEKLKKRLSLLRSD